jgi:thiol:disulfide interchange protein DsbD
LWQYLLLAFGGGLLAVIMPCVYPMLPMTVSYFTSMGGTRRRGVLMASGYGLSIMAIYTGAGVLLSLLFGADAATSISSHWFPNVLSFVIFLVFGLSFLGLFEINAPTVLVNKADAQADKGGWTGLFFMAATLVLVSFSCTVPIVGSVAIAAANGELLRPTLGMLAFSLAFALPFILFAMFPAWLKSLPRSGGWLNVLKVVLGFVELGMAFKFLSSADLSYHWGLVPRPLFLTIWIVLAALLGFYLLGKIRLPHDSDTAHVSVPRLLLAMVAFTFAIYMVPGLFGAPLPALSAIAPPPTRHDFNLATAGAAPAVATASTGCAPARFSSTLELPLGLNGYFTLQEALACAKQQGKPVFVDFTGHNCGNCRRMEAEVWSHEEVLRQLREDYVVVALYADDKTELPEAEWYTSTRDQRLKKTMGEQNLDYQIGKFNANAQPYYVLLDPNDPTGTPLAPPLAYEPDVAQFSRFLQAGVARFQQQRAVAAR